MESPRGKILRFLFVSGAFNASRDRSAGAAEASEIANAKDAIALIRMLLKRPREQGDIAMRSLKILKVNAEPDLYLRG